MMSSAHLLKLMVFAVAGSVVLPVSAFAAAPAQASSSLPQFDPTWFASQAFWLAIHFFVLYVLVARFILPNLSQALDRRSQRISGDIAQADKLQKEADEARLHYEKALQDARNGATALRTRMAGEMAAQQLAAEEKMAQDMATLTVAATNRIAQSQADMAIKIRTVAADAARDVVAKIAGVQADEATAQSMVNQVSAQIPLKEVA